MKYVLATIFTSLLVLATACSQAAPPTKSASDGIQVHGHWTITVTNPDGTLDAMHEFDNALIENELLPELLTGTRLINQTAIWSEFDFPHRSFIKLEGDSINKTNFDCDEPIMNYLGGGMVLAPITTVNKNKLILAAVCTVIQADNSPSITEVSTSINTQSPSQINSKTTTGMIMYGFTEHTFEVGKQIDVETGQILSFNISISFN